MKLDAASVFAAGGLLRTVMALYGEWQDRHMAVKYTDIDYEVFTDAARYVSLGQSPYNRDTYRYTPLLAYALLPNIFVHRLWGKFLFSAADLLVGLCIYTTVLRMRAGKPWALRASALWLFNPFTFAVSTRGSSDSMTALLLLAVLLGLLDGQFLLAGVLWGLSVHWRLFPVIYGPSIFLFISWRQAKSPSCRTLQAWLQRTAYGALSQGFLSFVSSSFATVAALTCLFYKCYGTEFLQHSLLYHATRRDPRHNFSVYFYHTYLTYFDEPGWGLEQMAFIQQAAVLLALSWRWAHHLPFSWLLGTIAFVAYNKVCTAQYFVWYFCLFPLVCPDLGWPASRMTMAAVLFWLAAQLNWLLWAYLLEFQGVPTFLIIWMSSVLFLVAHMAVMLSLMWAFRPRQSFLEISSKLFEQGHKRD
eukprot:evm.model.scf_2711EXC.1 EVM.evm.TU.scf_2711EXC.1   scf_2711EXC:605-5584(+)